MASRVLTLLALDASGAPQGSLSPTFTSYLVDGSTPGGGAPAISAVSGATGLYSFTVTLTAGQRLQAIVDLTASCTGQRYLAVAANFDDLFPAEATDAAVGYDQAALVSAIDAELTAEHGAGAWGGSAGSGSQTVSLTVQVDGQARQGARVDIFAGGSVAAQAWSNASGVVSVNLDPGTYLALVTSPDATWASTTVVVSSPNTITPSTLNGASASATEPTAPDGLSRTLVYTAPTREALLGPFASRDSWSLSRTISGLPSNITAAVFTVRNFAAPGASLVSATVTVTDATAPTGAVTITFDADDLDLDTGQYAYDLELTLADGSVRTVERGAMLVEEHPTP